MWPFKASLITSTTALETDKSIGRSIWSQYNNSTYADHSSLTYHQHYPALETDKSIGRSTWSQYNNSKNADFSSLTYHQHYPALETEKSIGRSNLNVWPWKPHLSPRHWVYIIYITQHLIGQDYWQMHKWKGQNAAQSLGKSLPKDLITTNPEGGDPQVYWVDKQVILHTGREGRNFSLLEPSLLSKARHWRKVLLQQVMVLL